jgi:hypothetical protein
MSMKNSSDTIGNGTRDLPASAPSNCATACPTEIESYGIKTRGKVPVNAWQVMKSCSKIMAAVPVRMAGDRKTSLNYYRFPCRVFARAFPAEQSICGSVLEWGGWSVAMATPSLMYVAVCMCVL